MKITLDIPDGIIAGFFNGVEVTAQTKGNLERLAAVCGYSEIGRVVDKLTREKMISLHDFERKENRHD